MSYSTDECQSSIKHFDLLAHVKVTGCFAHMQGTFNKIILLNYIMGHIGSSVLVLNPFLDEGWQCQSVGQSITLVQTENCHEILFWFWMHCLINFLNEYYFGL